MLCGGPRPRRAWDRLRAVRVRDFVGRHQEIRALRDRWPPLPGPFANDTVLSGLGSDVLSSPPAGASGRGWGRTRRHRGPPHCVSPRVFVYGWRINASRFFCAGRLQIAGMVWAAGAGSTQDCTPVAVVRRSARRSKQLPTAGSRSIIGCRPRLTIFIRRPVQDHRCESAATGHGICLSSVSCFLSPLEES